MQTDDRWVYVIGVKSVTFSVTRDGDRPCHARRLGRIEVEVKLGLRSAIADFAHHQDPAIQSKSG